jgi:hypothetical protein
MNRRLTDSLFLSARVRALAGGVLWTAGLLLALPSPFDPAWAKALLLLAPLVLVPLGLDLAATTGTVGRPIRLWHVVTCLQLPAAVLLGTAYFLPQGSVACCLAIPWLATTALMALCGLLWLRQRGLRPWDAACVDAGLVYAAVGGAWALADRLGFRPLDFDPIIVLLTAIHFHYAGFLLPIATGLAMRHCPGRVAGLAGLGVVVSVPLVAVGITASQLRAGPVIECAAAWLMAAGGVLTAWLHLQLALASDWPRLVRVLWLTAGLSLLGSMALAATYGSRFYAPVAWLDIPWMRVLHGTANALGFGLAGVLGWYLARPSTPADTTAKGITG